MAILRVYGSIIAVLARNESGRKERIAEFTHGLVSEMSHFHLRLVAHHTLLQLKDT